MCSIAAGSSASSSTVACIASATDAKKTRPRPFSRGSGTMFSSAEQIAPSVPSLAEKISVRSSGSRRKPLDAVSAPALQHAGRHPFGDLGGMPVHELCDHLPLCA
jgi:hypothetical protein